MSQELAHEQLIRSYLLGELPENEQERLEERVVTGQDQDFFDEVLIIEDELLDDYALGDISERERAKLESRLLKSPHQYQKVEFVKTLERYIALTKAAPATVENKVEDREQQLWEQTLCEAHGNRNLILSLMNNDWLGMELLLQLEAVQQARLADLASFLERDESSLKAVVVALTDSKLINEYDGKYSCSEMGREIVKKANCIIRSP